jgi:hypothetical protein
VAWGPRITYGLPTIHILPDFPPVGFVLKEVVLTAQEVKQVALQASRFVW